MRISRSGAWWWRWRWRRKIAFALVLGAALAAPARASAQPTPDELAAARQLFNEGKDLEKQKAYAGAIEKFKKVAGVKMTPQVRFHIALCEENLGHLVEAINGFELAGKEAKLAGSTATEVAENAPRRAVALRGRVPTLRLDIKGKVLTSRILLDGAPVASSQIGVAAPIDPGDHVVEAQDAAGKATFHKDLQLKEKEVTRLEIPIDDVERAPAPASAAPLAPPAERSRAPVFLAGGVGVASLIASGVFFGLRAGTISTVAASCADPVKYTGCQDTADVRAAMASGRAYSTITSVTLGVGLAGLGAAGILWFVTSPKKAPAPVKTGVMLVPSGPGLDVVGVF
jgi:hypothetical protein